MEITKTSAKPSFIGSKDWFTGAVWADPIFDPNGTRKFAGTHVRFEPGARTVWHTHPLGQTLIITSGSGWVQREGGAIEDVHQGDVVWFEANEKHWHGATATNGMTHIAIQESLDGKMVEWMEEVTKEEYSK